MKPCDYCGREDDRVTDSSCRGCGVERGPHFDIWMHLPPGTRRFVMALEAECARLAPRRAR